MAECFPLPSFLMRLDLRDNAVRTGIANFVYPLLKGGKESMSAAAVPEVSPGKLLGDYI